MNIFSFIRNIKIRQFSKLTSDDTKTQPRFGGMREQSFFSKLEASNLFDLFYIVPTGCLSHPLMSLMIENGKFRRDDPRNTIMLPIDHGLAAKLGVSIYSEDPCDAYVEGLIGWLDRIWDSPDGLAARSGNPSAEERIAEATFSVIVTIRAALVNGDLFVVDRQELLAISARPFE